MYNPPLASITNAVAITKSDTDTFQATRGIYVGASGIVKADMANGGSAIVFNGLAAGVIHYLSVTRIYSATTTATGIVALY